MNRSISFYTIRKNQPLKLDYHIARILDYKHDKNNGGLKINGCGMDMGFHVVYSLSNVIFKKNKKREQGYNLKQQWL